MKKISKIDPRVPIKDGASIQPVIIRVNKFNEEACKVFSEEMEKAYSTGQSFIPLVIDSYGGEVYSLMDMIDQITTSIIPVVTIVEGKAMSCGAILFCMGKQRYMSKNSTLMLHEVSNFNFGKTEEIKSTSNETDRLNKRIFELASLNIGKRKNYLIDLIHGKSHADWYLTGTQAKKHNICTRVGVPIIYTEITLNHSLVI